VMPDVFERDRLVLVNAPSLLVEGTLQNIDNVTSVRTAHVAALAAAHEISVSHDFH